MRGFGYGMLVANAIWCVVLLLTGCASSADEAAMKACRDAGGSWLDVGNRVIPSLEDGSCVRQIKLRVIADSMVTR